MAITSTSNLGTYPHENVEALKNYKYEEHEQSVIELSKDPDVKLCGVVGRGADEPLPDKPGWKYISIDLIYAEGNPKPGRIHLKRDFTQLDQVAKLKGVFDELLVDQSTCKCFNTDFVSVFTTTLKPKESSRLIFEETPYLFHYDETIERPINRFGSLILPQSYMLQDTLKDNEYYSEYEATHTENERNADFRNVREKLAELDPAYKKWPDHRIKGNVRAEIIGKIREEKRNPPLMRTAQEQAISEIKSLAETLFQKVEHIKDALYPCPTKYSVGHDNFFICTGVIVRNTL